MNGNSHKFTINPNTGISIGIFLTLVAGIVAGAIAFGGINSSITASRLEIQAQITAVKSELTTKVDKVESRVNTIESNKNGVTTTNFFKWAVHLQQANPQIKVPEPEVDTK